MKKILMILMLLVVATPLAACTTQTSEVSEKHQQTAEQSVTEQLQKKRSAWDAKVKGAEVVHTNDFSGDFIGPAKSIDELSDSKTKDYYFVKGTEDMLNTDYVSKEEDVSE